MIRTTRTRMTTRLPLFAMALLGIGLLILSGCQAAADSSGKAATATQGQMYATQQKWQELFTFKPKSTTPQLPQTRYCYHTQSDVVCYDSPQSTTTSPMVGYQDGANLSWFQPGGGSLGVSGGEATAVYSANLQPAPPSAVLSETNVAPNADCMPGTPDKPFYCNESPYVKGAVTSNDITTAAH